MFVCECFLRDSLVTQSECCRRCRRRRHHHHRSIAAAVTATVTHKRLKATTKRNNNTQKTIIAKQIQVQVCFGSQTIFFSYFIQFASDCLLVEVTHGSKSRLGNVSM